MSEKYFVNWINSKLKKVGKSIVNIAEGFNDGLNLVAFLEVLSE